MKLFHLIIKSRGKNKKNVHDYSQKLIDDLKLIVVNPPPKLTDEGKRSIATFFSFIIKIKVSQITQRKLWLIF